MAAKRLLAILAVSAMTVGQGAARGVGGRRLPAPAASQEIGKRRDRAGDEMPAEEKKALEAKAVALVGQMVAEAASMQMAENRIFVLCFAAEVLWKREETRARGYLQDATAQFLAMEPLPAEPGIRGAQAWRDRSNLRSTILQTVSKFDPRMGLDFLRASRQAVANGAPGPAAELQARQDYEKNYEMQLAVQIAENDPQMALQLAEEALRSDLTYQVIEIWRRLLPQDGPAGIRLTNLLLAKLKASDFAKNQNHLSIVNEMAMELRSRLQEAKSSKATQKPSPAPAAELEPIFRELLDLIAAASLRITPANFLDIQEQGYARNLLGYAKSLLPDLEKHLPGRASLVRAKLTQFDKAYYHPSPVSQEEYSEMQKKTAAELVALGDAAKGEEKQIIYSQALAKAIEEGNTELARQISKQHLSGAQNEYLDREINRAERERAVREGKIEEARKALAAMQNDVDRARELVLMAAQAEAAKDAKTRRQLLEEARALLGDRMETRSHVEVQIALAAASLDLDADNSFDTLAAAVEKLNVVFDATLMLMRFSQELPQEMEILESGGEMRLAQAGVMDALIGQWDLQLIAFARKDFARTVAAIDRWRSVSMRMTFKMNLVTAILGDETMEARPRFIFERGIR